VLQEAITPRIECEDSSENYGKFVVEPLEPPASGLPWAIAYGACCSARFWGRR